MEGRLFLDVVVRQCASVLELFAGEDQSLLVWWDTFLVLDLSLHILDRIGSFDLESDGLARQCFHEDLHTTTESENQVKGRLFLDVVVRKGASILELFAGEDQSLLVWWDTFLVLDLSFDILNGVRSFDLECNGFAGQGFHEDLHTTTKSENQVEGRLLLDVVVGKSPSVLELFPSEDKSLLIWWDTFLVLNLSLDVLNCIRSFHLESDGLSSERLDENLHTTTKSKNQVEGRLFLYVVVRKGASIFQLLASKDESLLIWWDSFLVLNLSLDVLDCIGSFDLKCDGLASERLDENLHTTTESKNQVEGRLLLDVIVGQCAPVLELFPSEDESLLIWWDAFLVLDLSLDVLNGVRSFDLESDGLSSERFDEDLHF